MNVAQLESAKKYILYLKRFLPKFKEKTSNWFRKVTGTTTASQELANIIFEYSLNTSTGLKGALSAYGTHLYQANDVLLQGLDYLRAFAKRIASVLTLVNECESLVDKCLKYIRSSSTPQLPTQQTGPVGSGSPIPAFLNLFSTLQTTLRSALQVFLTAHARVSMVASCRMVQGADDLGRAILAIDDLDMADNKNTVIGLDGYGTSILGHTVDIRGVPSVEIKESQRVLGHPDNSISSFGARNSLGMGTSVTPAGNDFTFTNQSMSQTPNTPRSSSKKRSKSAGKIFDRIRHKRKSKHDHNPNTAMSPGDEMNGGMNMGMQYNTPGGYNRPQGSMYNVGTDNTQFNMNTVDPGMSMGNTSGMNTFNPNINTNFGQGYNTQDGMNQKESPGDDFGF